MAEAEKPKDGEGEAAPKKSKKKLIIFIVIGVVVLALVGVGAMLMMKKKHSAEDGEGAGETTSESDKSHDHPPVYVKLEAFTTNLAQETTTEPSSAAGQYIQVVVEMKVEDAKADEELKKYMPEIRNNILRLLSSKAPSQLSSSEGKDKLAGEIRDSVNGITNPGEKKGSKGPSGPVLAVLFSSFIIQ